jgi:hypothetical protein
MARVEIFEAWPKGKPTPQKIKTDNILELTCNSESFIFQTLIQKHKS